MYTGCDGHKWALIKLLPRSHHGIGVAEISLSKVVKDFSRRLWEAVNQNLKLAHTGTDRRYPVLLEVRKTNPASEAARGTLLADFHSWLASFLTQSRPPHSFGSFRVRPLECSLLSQVLFSFLFPLPNWFPSRDFHWVPFLAEPFAP